MIIDTHIHVFSYPSFRDLSKYIRTMEDATQLARMQFRSAAQSVTIEGVSP